MAFAAATSGFRCSTECSCAISRSKRVAKFGSNCLSLLDSTTGRYTGANIRRLAHDALRYRLAGEEGLFRAVMHQSQQMVLGVMIAAMGPGSNVRDQLIRICSALFQFTCEHRSLMRLVLGHSLGVKAKTPTRAQCQRVVKHQFVLVQDLMTTGVANGTLSREFDSMELAVGFLGMVHSEMLAGLADPDYALTPQTAERVARLFLKGATPRDTHGFVRGRGKMPARRRSSAVREGKCQKANMPQQMHTPAIPSLTMPAQRLAGSAAGATVNDVW